MTLKKPLEEKDTLRESEGGRIKEYNKGRGRGS
jgi:hypothetical protein